MKNFFLFFFIALTLNVFSQNSATKLIEISFKNPIYKFDNYSKTTLSNDKVYFTNDFSPEIELAYTFGKSSKFKHSILIAYQEYSYSYSVEIPSLSLEFSPLSNQSNYYDKFNFNVIKMAYRLNYQFHDKLIFNAMFGIEERLDHHHLETDCDIWYAASKGGENPDYQEYTRITNSIGVTGVQDFLITSLGLEYKINDKFQLLTSIDIKPFGGSLVMHKINYGVNSIGWITTNMYCRYLNFSMGIKYALPLN